MENVNQQQSLSIAENSKVISKINDMMTGLLTQMTQLKAEKNKGLKNMIRIYEQPEGTQSGNGDDYKPFDSGGGFQYSHRLTKNFLGSGEKTLRAGCIR